ncbi:hypothetical protein Efla_005255 [Eimeria flavescens]
MLARQDDALCSAFYRRARPSRTAEPSELECVFSPSSLSSPSFCMQVGILPLPPQPLVVPGNAVRVLLPTKQSYWLADAAFKCVALVFSAALLQRFAAYSEAFCRGQPPRETAINGAGEDWEYLYRTANAERNRLEFENRAIGASFEKLFQKAYNTEVQLRNVRAFAERCAGVYAPNQSDVRELVTLITSILSLLANSTSEPIISRVPEIVAMVSACPVHDQRLYAASEQLKRKAGDCGLAASSGPKTQPPSTSEGGASIDLRWLAAATKDDAWLQMSDRWEACPVDLRWLAVATNDRSWLLNRFVWRRSPTDLRWMSVATYNREWLLLGASDRWQATPAAIKLRAIEANDPSIVRPSLSEAAQFKLDIQMRSDIQREVASRSEAFSVEDFACRGESALRLSAADLTASPQERKPFASLATTQSTEKGAPSSKTAAFPKEGVLPAGGPPKTNSAPPPIGTFMEKEGTIPIKSAAEAKKAPGAVAGPGAPKTAAASVKGAPLAGKTVPSPLAAGKGVADSKKVGTPLVKADAATTAPKGGPLLPGKASPPALAGKAALALPGKAAAALPGKAAAAPLGKAAATPLGKAAAASPGKEAPSGPPGKAAAAAPGKAAAALAVKEAPTPPGKAAAPPAVKEATTPPGKAATPPGKAAPTPPGKAAATLPGKEAPSAAPGKAAPATPGAPAKAAPATPGAPAKAAPAAPAAPAKAALPAPGKAAPAAPGKAAPTPPEKASATPPGKEAPPAAPGKAAAAPLGKAAAAPPGKAEGGGGPGSKPGGPPGGPKADGPAPPKPADAKKAPTMPPRTLAPPKKATDEAGEGPSKSAAPPAKAAASPPETKPPGGPPKAPTPGDSSTPKASEAAKEAPPGAPKAALPGAPKAKAGLPPGKDKAAGLPAAAKSPTLPEAPESKPGGLPAAKDNKKAPLLPPKAASAAAEGKAEAAAPPKDKAASPPPAGENVTSSLPAGKPGPPAAPKKGGPPAPASKDAPKSPAPPSKDAPKPPAPASKDAPKPPAAKEHFLEGPPKPPAKPGAPPPPSSAAEAPKAPLPSKGGPPPAPPAKVSRGEVARSTHPEAATGASQAKRLVEVGGKMRRKEEKKKKMKKKEEEEEEEEGEFGHLLCEIWPLAFFGLLISCMRTRSPLLMEDWPRLGSLKRDCVVLLCTGGNSGSDAASALRDKLLKQNELTEEDLETVRKSADEVARLAAATTRVDIKSSS